MNKKNLSKPTWHQLFKENPKGFFMTVAGIVVILLLVFVASLGIFLVINAITGHLPRAWEITEISISTYLSLKLIAWLRIPEYIVEKIPTKILGNN